MILCFEDLERRTDHREEKVGVPDIGVTLVTRAKRGQYVAGEEAFSFFSGDNTRLFIIVTDGIKGFRIWIPSAPFLSHLSSQRQFDR